MPVRAKTSVSRWLLAAWLVLSLQGWTQTNDGARQAAQSYRLGLRFESNVGQYPEGVKFVARQPNNEIFLTADEAAITLPMAKADSQTVRIKFLNAKPHPIVEGEDPLTGAANYIFGNDPKLWHTGAPVFQRVHYRDLYPGVDLLYYSNNDGHLEHDFIINPGAFSDEIRLRIAGAKSVALSEDGDLRLATGGTELQLKRPVAYQDGANGRELVASHFVLHEGGEVSIAIGAYDHARTLIVDPQLYYNNPTFGGTSIDIGNGVAADAQGNMYIVGTTFSSDIQFTGTAQAVWSGGMNCGPYGSFSVCSDAFVVKIDPQGTVVYFTYLGGSLNDAGTAIAVDASGNAYITGSTQSTNFPVLNPAQLNWGGGTNCGAAAESRNCTDAFVAALDANGHLVYSTYLGGSANDAGTAIAVAPSGTAWVTGKVASTDLVTTQGAFATTCAVQNNLCADGFIAQLSSAAALNYLSYLRGTGSAVATDGSLLAYLTGTASSNFLTTGNAYQSTAGGATDGFLATVDATQTGAASLPYASYLGTSGGSGTGIAVDSAPNVCVTAVVGQVARVMKLNLANSGAAQLLYNTALPSPAHVTIGSPSLDGSGVLWFEGTGVQLPLPNFPTTSQYVASLNSSGAFGGTDLYFTTDTVSFSGLTVDASGAVDVVGTTYKNNPGDVMTLKFVANQPANWLISPNPVIFPKQSLVAQPQANAIATNGTGASDSISNITISPGFSLNTNCGAVAIPKGNFCTFLITFIGKSSGITTGTLSFTTGTAPTNHKVLLYVDAGLPVVVFNPASVDFGTVPLGSSATRTTVLSNTGDGIYPLGTITAPNITESHDCGTSVPAKGTCNFRLTFAPHTNTDAPGNVVVSPYPNGVTYQLVPPVTLNVAGGTQSTAGITLAPATLSFQNLVLNTTTPAQTVTFTNATSSAINNIQIGATGDFTLDNATTTCGSTLAANSSCMIGATFTPTVAGTRVGSITEVDSGDGFRISRAVGLVGNAAGTPALSVSPTSLSFGALLAGVTAVPKTITLSNSTTATWYLVVTNIATDGPYVQENNCVAPIAPGGSCTITVVFTPPAVGSQPGHVTILSNAAKKVINLSGTGNAPAPVLSGLSPSSRFNGSPDLNLVVKGSNFSTNSVVVWNAGSAVSLATAYISPNTLNATVPAALLATAGSAQVTVSTPTPGGGNSAAKTFTITTNNPPTGALESAIYLPTMTSTVPQGNFLTVTGWAADTDQGAPVAQVQVHVDPVSGTGNVVQSATLAGGRTDIVTSTGRHDYYYSGWTATVSTAALSPGTYTVSAVAFDSAGASTTLPSSQPITVSAARAGPVAGVATAVVFGSAIVGATLQQLLTVTNVGSGTLNINSIGMTGPLWVTNNCAAGVNAGASCTLLVSFVPAAVGPASGILSINSNGTPAAVGVSLSGSGLGLVLKDGRPSRPVRPVGSPASAVAPAATTVAAPPAPIQRVTKIPHSTTSLHLKSDLKSAIALPIAPIESLPAPVNLVSIPAPLLEVAGTPVVGSKARGHKSRARHRANARRSKRLRQRSSGTNVLSRNSSSGCQRGDSGVAGSCRRNERPERFELPTF